MNNSFPLFIGFSQLENWLKAIDVSRPVFADLVIESEHHGDYPHTSGGYGQLQEKYTVMVAQPGADDLVYYCRLVVVQETRLSGSNIDKKHEDRASQAMGIIQAWLKEQGLTVHEALIASPFNLKFIDGWANFLVFDNKTQQYVRN